ncbi:MAG: tetratricopeptide repeat protein [Deltaproteobacteria bacterium]|uniref:Tetratricopeptide repeat protein n=1 Tax=Candidatus Zymogenus saltonus TaxID=2844893 RepID=A0A9D8KE74_9DELT|nr:tetratricopeptide repeat protein [Candidatus Zymogenus saltonus]
MDNPIVISILLFIAGVLVAILLYLMGSKKQTDDHDELKKEIRELKLALERITKDVPIQLDPANPPKLTEEDSEILDEIDEAREEIVPIADLGELIKFGNLEYSKSNYDSAFYYYKVALERAKESGDEEAKAAALGNIGLIYKDKGEPDKALKYHEDALKIHKETGYKQGQANQLGNIGLIYQNKGEPDKALKYHEDALKIHKEIGYKQGEANQLGNIGLIYQNKGELDKALKYHEDALKIDKEIGHKLGQASDLGNIGLIYQDKGEPDKALKYLRESLTIFEETGIVYQKDIAINAIAEIEAELKKKKKK